MGYGICYCGAVRETLPQIDSKMSLPIGVFPLYALAVGSPSVTHPSEWSPRDASLRPRLPVDAVLMTDAYLSDSAMKTYIIEHDDEAAEYYSSRSSVGAPKKSIRPTVPAPAADDGDDGNGKEETTPKFKRSWSGTDFMAQKRREGSQAWKSMLDKFGDPQRTHLLSFYTRKGANFEPVSQALALGRYYNHYCFYYYHYYLSCYNDFFIYILCVCV